jgi:hypothetical protein
MSYILIWYVSVFVCEERGDGRYGETKKKLFYFWFRLANAELNINLLCTLEDETCRRTCTTSPLWPYIWFIHYPTQSPLEECGPSKFVHPHKCILISVLRLQWNEYGYFVFCTFLVVKVTLRTNIRNMKSGPPPKRGSHSPRPNFDTDLNTNIVPHVAGCGERQCGGLRAPLPGRAWSARRARLQRQGCSSSGSG